MSVLAPEIAIAREAMPLGIAGRAASVRGMTVLVDDLPCPIGALVSMKTLEGARLGEVVGFTRDHSVVMPLERTLGVRPGDTIELVSARQTAMVGRRLVGRVINGLGEPIDGKGPITERVARPLNPEPIPALARPPIREPLRTGVRVIDLMTPLGRGQRVGVFAGPGVGKSTLMASVARNTEARVNVIALVGERGREVAGFIEDALGEEGLKRSVVVVATGDESPPMRLRAARLACCAAEHFRNDGLDVMLMMDSVTRFAHAQRQIGLSVGEPPATKGYTPSVFAELPLLLERAGLAAGAGSITGLYTILVEGDHMTEPIADAARGILDGHIALSRKLAQRAHYPAVDVLGSVSRVADEISDAHERSSRRQLMRLLGRHAEVEDLVRIGAYARGADPESDVAVEYKDAIDRLIQQGGKERSKYDADRSALIKLAMETGEQIQARTKAKAAQQAGGARKG